MCFPPLIVTNSSLESRAIGPILQTRKLRLKEVKLPAQDPRIGISAPRTEILSPDSRPLCRLHGSGSSSPEAGPQPVGTKCWCGSDENPQQEAHATWHLGDALPHVVLHGPELWTWTWPWAALGLGSARGPRCDLPKQDPVTKTRFCAVPMNQRVLGSGNMTMTMKSLSCVWLFVTPWTTQPTRLLCPWNFLGKNTEVGCHSLLQGIFLIQGSNPCPALFIVCLSF